MSNLKKKLRALGAKVKKSTPVDPAKALDANMAMFLNAQGAFLTSEVAKAREAGLKMGIGIDAAESLRLLAVENAKLRGALEAAAAALSRIGETDAPTGVISLVQDASNAIDDALSTPPQRFVLKADASAPTAPSDFPPAAAPQGPAAVSLAPALPDAPPADAQPGEAAPLPH